MSNVSVEKNFFLKELAKLFTLPTKYSECKFTSQAKVFKNLFKLLLNHAYLYIAGVYLEHFLIYISIKRLYDKFTFL